MLSNSKDELQEQQQQHEVELNDVRQGSKLSDAASSKPSLHPEDDPAFYNTWKLILSLPVNKAKAQALFREVMSGVTVALAQVPEAVAFSFTAGVSPIIGLQAAWLMCLISGLFGGAPGLVSGATGAIAVVLPDFVEEYGVGYLFMSIFIMGILQIVIGLIGGAKLIRFVGHPIMLGFCNGLAVVIAIAQLHSFEKARYCSVKCDSPDYDWNSCIQVDPSDDVPDDYPHRCTVYITGATAGWQAFECVATMAVIYFLPKLTLLFPASLAGIIVGTVIEFAIVRTTGFETPTVGDTASVKGFFPIPVWVDDRYKSEIPSLGDIDTWTTCLPTAAIMAVIGLVESLMTLQLVGQITGKRPNPNAEVFAQGSASIIVGMFGGMGGCAMIGQSMINVGQNRARTRISTAVAGIFLLLIILVVYPAINLVPMASLAGVMFMVVIGTFEWHSIPIIVASLLPERFRSHPRLNWARKIKRTDVIVIALVTIVAVVANLAYAVASGVVFAALVFAWDSADHLEVNPVEAEDLVGRSGSMDYIRTNKRTGSGSDDIEQHGAKNFADDASSNLGEDKKDPMNVSDEEIMLMDPTKVKVYQVKGPLFFASAQRFEHMFHPHHDPDTVILYLDQAVLSDYSALAALNSVSRVYTVLQKRFLLRKVTSHSLRSIRQAGHLIYTFDKTQSAQVNENELLNMALAPSWETIEIDPGYDSQGESDSEATDLSGHKIGNEKGQQNSVAQSNSETTRADRSRSTSTNSQVHVELSGEIDSQPKFSASV